jgi:uncharacterized protein YcfL
MRRIIPRSLKAQALLILLSLATAGCKSSGAETDTGPAQPGPMEPTVTAPTDDSAVSEHLVQHLKSTRVVGGLREVDLDLENRSEAPVRFSYQVEWLNRVGEQVTDVNAVWTPLVLNPGERTPLELRAPHPVAESWRLVAVALEPAQAAAASIKTGPAN